MKIFILLATNDSTSFCKSIFDNAVDSLSSAQNQIKTLEFSENDFDPDLTFGYKKRKELEPTLEQFINNYIWCDKLLIIYPIWWGQPPAKLKGLIDRAVLPGVLVTKNSKTSMLTPLYSGKKVETICLMHAPKVFSLFMPNKKIIRYIFFLGLKAKIKVNYIQVSNELTHEQVVLKSQKIIKKMK